MLALRAANAIDSFSEKVITTLVFFPSDDTKEEVLVRSQYLKTQNILPKNPDF